MKTQKHSRTEKTEERLLAKIRKDPLRWGFLQTMKKDIASFGGSCSRQECVELGFDYLNCCYIEQAIEDLVDTGTVIRTGAHGEWLTLAPIKRRQQRKTTKGHTYSTISTKKERNNG